MIKKLQKFRDGKFIALLKRGLSSKYFPFISAAVTLLCYYLSWDMALIYYITIVGVLILLLLDDLTPLVSVMLFFGIFGSYNNSPSLVMEESDYYFQTANIVQIFILMTVFVVTGLYKIGLTVARKRFTLTPAFWGLCALSAALLFNGLFIVNYQAKNMLFGLLIAACFLILFCLLKDNVKLDGAGYEKIAFAFIAFGTTLIIELVVKYLTADDLFIDGSFNRNILRFGWGIWNTAGLWLTMCIPAALYLAYKKRLGFLFHIYALILFIAVCMTLSRQSIVVAAIIYLIGVIVLIVKGRYRIVNIILFAVAATAVVAVLIVLRETAIKIIKETVNDLLSYGGLKGNTRLLLWKQAIDNYRFAPLFGKGFFGSFSKPSNSGLGFIPYMAHNTFLQLLSSCGTVGFIVYIVHRVQTVQLFCKKITVDRTFIALTILPILLMGLADNHIFNVFPTIIYSSLLGILAGDTLKNYEKPSA